MARQSQRSEPEAAQSPHDHSALDPRSDGRGGTEDIPEIAAAVGVKVLRPATPQSLHHELSRLRNDRRIWKLALRCAEGDHDLAEDALQETCWAILHMKNPERIDNLEAYFCTVLKHTAAEQCVYKSKAPLPADNLEAVAGEVDRGGVTPDAELSRPVDACALSNVLASAWLARLCSQREQRADRSPPLVRPARFAPLARDYWSAPRVKVQPFLGPPFLCGQARKS
jgi:Sigma-70 region 2